MIKMAVRYSSDEKMKQEKKIREEPLLANSGREIRSYRNGFLLDGETEAELGKEREETARAFQKVPIIRPTSPPVF